MRKYGMLVLATMFMISLAISAQEQNPPQGRKGERKEFKQADKLQVSPEKRAEKMAKELALTDAQKVKVQALFEKQEAKRLQHQTDMKKQKEEQMAKFEAERKAQDAELVKIIGQEKFLKLENERKEFGAKMQDRRQGNQRHQPERGHQNKEYNRAEFPKVSAENRADRMAKTLGLTDAEKSKVQGLFEKQDAKREQHLATVKKVRDEQLALVETEHKSMNADLEKIIGTDKFQKLESKRSEFKAKVQERREGNQHQPQGGDMNRRDPKMAKGPMVSPEKRAEKLNKVLGLTETQKAEVQALFEKQDAKRQQEIDKVMKMREEMKAKYEAEHKANDEALANIIGQDKFQKLQALRSQHKDKMNNNMRKGHKDHSPENNGDQK